MKNKLFTLALMAFTVCALVQCNSKEKDKLEGVWKLQMLEINGTQLSGASLGDWKWEFNEEGGYLTDVAGAREKGLYTLKGDKLTLKSVTNKERPEQVLSITHIDSLYMDLVNADAGKNKSSLHFIKMKESDYEEKD